MNLKRKLLSITITATVLILLTGCSANMNKIYSDNKKIASEDDSYTLNKSVTNLENGTFTGSFKLSGSLTLWSYDSDKDDNLQVPYNLSVKSGKAKLVLITPDNEVVDLVENSKNAAISEDTTINVPLKKGNNRIRLIGYKQSSIHLNMKIDKGEFLEK